MMSLVYDGSWGGLLTCIFEAYERKLQAVSVVRKQLYSPGFFNDCITVQADDRKAGRVLKGLRRNLSPAGFLGFYACYLSELPQMEEWLLAYTKLVFSLKNAECAFGNDTVLKVSQTARMVFRESHRMKGFVRFALTRDNIFYSEVEPDFNVLPLISGHFKQRFTDQQWLIYDKKRKYGIYYNLEEVTEVQFEPPSRVPAENSGQIFAEPEMQYQKLWKEYFVSTDIESRKNTRLQLRHMPKRYWKYLTETHDQASE